MRTRLAKTVYWLSGALSYIKTPQRVYEIDSLEPYTSKPSGRIWLPCSWSMDLLLWSAQLDRTHWDHWAIVHTDCGGLWCPDCGGFICGADW